MNPKAFLDDLINEISSIRRAADLHFGQLSEEQLNWRPPSGKWSISQHFTHLNLLNQLYSEEIREALKAGKDQDRKAGNFHYSLLGQWFVNLMKPNSRFSFKAFKAVQPTANGEGRKSLTDFFELQDQLLLFLKEAYDVDLVKNKIGSPVFALLKLRLGEAFEVVIVHEKRHLLHAQAVVKNPDFPLVENETVVGE